MFSRYEGACYIGARWCAMAVDAAVWYHPAPGTHTLLVPCSLHAVTNDTASLQSPLNFAIVLPLHPRCAISVQDGSEVEPAFEGGMDVDMLLLDIQMKTMNGDVLCSLLRAQGDPRMMIAVTGEQLRIVAMTSALQLPLERLLKLLRLRQLKLQCLP